jgi:inorganic pyrophosphatase
MQLNPWHSIECGDNAPEVVNGIIEISKGSRAKYELDKETGLLKLDRVLRSAVFYPANYGFIPKTYCDDGDPLDILVLSSENILPMTLVEAKVIGAMKMIDGGEGDDKLIAVLTDDMSVAHFNDISELPEYTLKEIRQFFAEYKALENKKVEITDFVGAAAARDIMKQAMVDYNEQILPTLK